MHLDIDQDPNMIDKYSHLSSFPSGCEFDIFLPTYTSKKQRYSDAMLNLLHLDRRKTGSAQRLAEMQLNELEKEIHKQSSIVI